MGSHRGAQAGAEGRALLGPLVVELPVGPLHLGRVVRCEQSHEGDHVGLLEHLGIGGQAGAAPQVLGGGQDARLEFLERHVLQAVVAVELLDHQAAGVRRGHVQELGELLQVGQFGLQAEPGHKVGVVVGALGPGPLEHLQGQADTVASHGVGVRVVGHTLVVLVWPGHVDQLVAVLVLLEVGPAAVEAGALHQDLRPTLVKDRVVAGNDAVLPDGVRHVSTDVDLFVAEVRPQRTVGEDIGHVEQRAGVAAIVLAFPGEIGTFEAVLGRFAPGPRRACALGT